MKSKAGGFTVGWCEVFGYLYSMSGEVPNASTPQARRKKSALTLSAMLRSQAMQSIKSAPTWRVLRGNFADRKTNTMVDFAK
jgi:hypothetical protein